MYNIFATFKYKTKKNYNANDLLLPFVEELLESDEVTSPSVTSEPTVEVAVKDSSKPIESPSTSNGIIPPPELFFFSSSSSPSIRLRFNVSIAMV